MSTYLFFFFLQLIPNLKRLYYFLTHPNFSFEPKFVLVISLLLGYEFWWHLGNFGCMPLLFWLVLYNRKMIHNNLNQCAIRKICHNDEPFKEKVNVFITSH